MFRSLITATCVGMMSLVSSAVALGEEPTTNEIKSYEDVQKQNAELVAAGVPQIYFHARYIQVDTDMYDIFIDGYRPNDEKSDQLPALSTNLIQVVPRNSMREVTDPSTKPVPFGMQHLVADLREGYVFEGVVLDGIAEVKVGTTNYKFDNRDMPKTFPEDAETSEKLIGVRYLRAPLMLTFSGMNAAVTSGYTRPYLIKDEDGCLRLPENSEFTDGSHLDVVPTLQDDGTILLDPMVASFSQMIGREEIEGVPLDVGKPIVQTAYMSMTFAISQKATAVFALPRFDEDAPVILVLIRAYVAPPTTQPDTTPKAGDTE